MHIDGFQHIQTLRAGTPDSIGSTGSSNQPRPLSAQQNRHQPLQPVSQQLPAQVPQQLPQHQHVSPQSVQDTSAYQQGDNYCASVFSWVCQDFHQ